MIPQNSVNRKIDITPTTPRERESFNEGYRRGYDDCRKSDRDWLFSPCTEHPQGYTGNPVNYEYQDYPKHRYKCPECMKELEGVKL